MERGIYAYLYIYIYIHTYIYIYIFIAYGFINHRYTLASMASSLGRKKRDCDVSPKRCSSRRGEDVGCADLLRSGDFLFQHVYVAPWSDHILLEETAPDIPGIHSSCWLLKNDT